VESALELRIARARHDVGLLLPVAAPVALLAFMLAAVAPGLVNQDTWLTLVDGRAIAEHGLPHHHATVMGGAHAFVDQQWLAQLVLYALGSAGAAVAVCLAASLLAVGLCAWIAQRRGASALSILSFAVWAAIAAPWGFQVRAQSLALLLFALVLVLLEGEVPWLTLPVLAVWANVHGSVVVGVLLVVAHALVRRRPLLLCAPLCMVVSPYARELPGYYRTMLLDPPFGHAIKEWQHTRPSALTAAFFALLALSVVFARRLSWRDRIVLLLLAVLALDAIRGLIWFVLAALAFLPAVATRRESLLRGTRSTCVAVAGAAAAVISTGSAFYGPRVPVPTRGPVFANEATADYLLWREPSLRVAYDVQFETLTAAQIDRLLAWRKFEPGWARVPNGYRVVIDDPEHVARLVALHRGWRQTFVSGKLAVAER
jgi:hypothetical protein